MRRRGCQDSASVSLFPFLAVLICTMGALIVLLVVVMQQAGKAVTAAPPPPPEETGAEEEQRAELEQQHQDLAWEARVLAESREETMRRLREQQTQLSMFEDQARQLKLQLDQLFDQSEQLDRLHGDQDSFTEEAARDKAELERQVVQAKYELEQLRSRQKQSESRFAIVPYDGPHGTQRRPIYVECQGNSIVIQPEGVRLVPEDFPLPLDQNNTLAIVLRAIREYWVNVGLVKTSQEPYPLLIVRPHGEDAFSICRHALRDWGDDFGYELLPEGIQIAYPQPDAHLKTYLERAIEEARWRQSQQVVRRPQGIVLSTTSRQGGFVREDQTAYARGAYPASSSNPLEALRSSGPGGGRPPLARDAAGDFVPSPSSAAAAAGASSPVPHGTGSLSAVPGQANGVDGANGRIASPSHSTGERGGAQGIGNYATGGQAMTQPFSESSAGTLAEGNRPWNSNAPPQNGAGGTGASTATNAGIGGTPGSNTGTPPEGSPTAMTQMGGCRATPLASVAQTQGANWALPGVAQGAIGIQRPLTVRCRGDVLELLPEPGSRQSTVAIPLQRGTQAAIKDLVSAVWNRINSWGIAGTGTYWKPVIETEVAADGEARYLELSQLMEDSGITVTRK